MEPKSGGGDDDIGLHSIGLQVPDTQSVPYEEMHGQSVDEHVPGTYESLFHVGPDYANLRGPTGSQPTSAMETKKH